MDDILKHYPEIKGIHPACQAVPLMSKADYKQLCADVRRNGLAEPLTVDPDGMLVDGRNRLKACYDTNTEIRTTKTSVDPWVFSATKNICRRHLTTGQKAMFAEACRSFFEKDAKQRQREHGGTAPGRTGKNTSPNSRLSVRRDSKSSEQAAKMAGVSHGSVDKARFVNTYLPEMAEQVRSGTKTLESAYREAKKLVPATNGKPKDDSAATVQVVTVSGKKAKVREPKKPTFNRTNDSVDWAKWTWNPVTGCDHGCEFCYAREIAHSYRMRELYPFKFEPTFHEYRLACPKNTKPQASDDPRERRAFVCSMADLFGKWVPNEWIRQVFDACLESPEWEYLFLTKWPARYAKMPLLPKAWYGASVVTQKDVKRVEHGMSSFEVKGGAIKWISLEPMLGPVKFSDLSWCNLVVIGSQTATTQPTGHVPAFAPEFDWVVDVVNQCREASVPYYLKENLGLQNPGMKLPKMAPSR